MTDSQGSRSPQATPPAASRPTLWLIGHVAISLAATAVLLAGLCVLADRPAWWAGYAAATLVSVLAATMSVLVLAYAISKGTYGMVAGHFAAAGVRALLSLGGCLVAVYAGGYPGPVTMLMMVPYYFAVLIAESIVTARLLWNRAA